MPTGTPFFSARFLPAGWMYLYRTGQAGLIFSFIFSYSPNFWEILFLLKKNSLFRIFFWFWRTDVSFWFTESFLLRSRCGTGIEKCRISSLFKKREKSASVLFFHHFSFGISVDNVYNFVYNLGFTAFCCGKLCVFIHFFHKRMSVCGIAVVLHNAYNRGCFFEKH